MRKLVQVLLILLLYSVPAAYAEGEQKFLLLCHIETGFQGVVDATYEIDLQNRTGNGFGDSRLIR